MHGKTEKNCSQYVAQYKSDIRTNEITSANAPSANAILYLHAFIEQSVQNH